MTQKQDTINDELKKKNEELTKRLEATQSQLAEMSEQLQVGDVGKSKPLRDGANAHPALKVSDICSLTN